MGTHDQENLLVQGGLEVPCQVTVSMSCSVVSHLLLSHYEMVLRKIYIEPKDEEIMETFFSITNE